MKIIMSVVLAGMLSVSPMAALAADKLGRYAIAPALAMKGTRDSLDPDVRLSFGSNPGGRVIGTYNSNKRARGTDTEACNTAFLSAVIALQQKALREGGNAVVNIHSYYKNKKFSSSKEFECANGRAMSAVTLRGTVVKR